MSYNWYVAIKIQASYILMKFNWLNLFVYGFSVEWYQFQLIKIKTLDKQDSQNFRWGVLGWFVTFYCNM